MDRLYLFFTMLIQTVWRKLHKDEISVADTVLSDISYDLICREKYSLAEKILTFGSSLRGHSSEFKLRMMVVNLANAIRLQGRPDDIDSVLTRYDWSAVGDEFKISVAAIRGETQEVVNLMKKIGPDGPVSISDYRTWPVFRGIRDTDEFKSTFLEVFDEEYLPDDTSGNLSEIIDDVMEEISRGGDFESSETAHKRPIH